MVNKVNELVSCRTVRYVSILIWVDVRTNRGKEPTINKMFQYFTTNRFILREIDRKSSSADLGLDIFEISITSAHFQMCGGTP